MLAVIRTGAVYVPLDLSAATERNALLVRDAELQAVIASSREVGESLGASATITVIELDGNRIGSVATHRPSPDDPFYIAYTSGSTGRPRGVTVTHGNIAWYAQMMPSTFDRRATDRFAVTTPFSFATSVRQTFVPLSLGAHISVATAAQAADPRALLEFLKQERVTAWEVVPSMLRACIDLVRVLPEEDRNRLLQNSLRQVGCIGEPLHAAVIRDWLDLGGRGEFTNSYGQSEASGLAVWPVDRGTIDSGGMVPAGRPTPGNVIRIVLPDGATAPDGETGEIVVEGPSVTLGYRDDNATTLRFTPRATADGHRRFLTGDLGRWRADGALEVLGRVDDQLKVRGVRVDPFEVEAVIRSHPAVRAAAVAVHERNGEGVLVAYICCVQQPPSAAEFRNILRTRLAGPMLPSTFVQVAELPYTASGKLDRRALPNPFSGNALSDADETGMHLATVQRAIANAWKVVLGAANVTEHDDFFALGGSSLSGAQVVEVLEHESGIRVTLTTVLNNSKLADLALEIEARSNHRRDPALVRIRSGTSPVAMLCVPGVKGRAPGMHSLGASLKGSHTVYAIDAEHAEIAGRSVLDVARTFATAAIEQYRGPWCVVGYSFGGVFALETARALRAAGAEVVMLALLDATVPDTPAIDDMTRALMAVEEYAALTALRLKRSLTDPFLYLRKLIKPAPWQEFRRAMRIALGDYRAAPLDVPTVFIRARSLPLVRGRTRVWRALTGAFREHSVWADHNDLLREPAASQVASILEHELRSSDLA